MKSIKLGDPTHVPQAVHLHGRFCWDHGTVQQRQLRIKMTRTSTSAVSPRLCAVPLPDVGEDDGLRRHVEADGERLGGKQALQGARCIVSHGRRMVSNKRPLLPSAQNPKPYIGMRLTLNVSVANIHSSARWVHHRSLWQTDGHQSAILPLLQ